MAVLLLADGGLERDRLLGDPEDLPDLVDRHIKLRGDVLGARLVAVLVQELGAHLLDLVDGLDHVDRDADGPGLVGDGAGDGLPDPPGRVGGKLKALGVVKFLDRLD